MNIQDLQIKDSTVLVQIVKDLPDTINTDIIAYLIMQGGYQHRGRIFAFDKGEDLGRKLFYFIATEYVELRNIKALNSYFKADSIWANAEYASVLTPVYNESGEQIDTEPTIITNSNHFNSVELNGYYYTRINDNNLAEIISMLTYTDNKANEVVFELPIVITEE